MTEKDSEDKKEPIFDLYNHLKCNIKCTLAVCEIHDSEFTNYCFQCKRSICDVCIEAFHNCHNNISKKQIGMDKIFVNKYFKNIESKVEKSIELFQPEAYKQKLKSNLNNEFNSIFDKLEKLKNYKLKEIEETFKNSSYHTNSLLQYIKEAKNNLNEYINEHKSFLINENIPDEDNFIFLLTYDMMNEVSQAGNDYVKKIDEIGEYFKSLPCNNGTNLKDIQEILDKKLNEQSKICEVNEKINNEILQTQQETLSVNSTKLVSMSNSRLTSKKNSQKSLYNASNLNQYNRSKTNNLKKETFCFNNEEFQIKKKEKKKFIENLEKLGENNYSELYTKIELIKDFIINFKLNIFQNFKKNGSLIEIEKLVKLYEEKSSKRVNFNGKSNLKFSNSTSSQVKSKLTRSKATFQIAKQDDKNGGENSEGNNQREESPKKEMDSKSQSKEKPKKAKSKKQNMNNKLNPGNDLYVLDENLGEDNSEYEDENEEDEYEDNSIEFNNLDNLIGNEEIEVQIENNLKRQDPKVKKLENMFKPLKRLYSKKKIDVDAKINKKQEMASSAKFKVNSRLMDLIKENQRLTSLIKTQEDISLQITTIRRYFAFCLLDYIRKNYKMSNKLDSSIHLTDSKKEFDMETNDDVIKFEENTNKLIIFNRKTLKKEIREIEFSTKKHGTHQFPIGARHVVQGTKIYISGGKINNGFLNIFLCYDLSEKKLFKMASMNIPRAYHSMQFHENLKSIIVVGGEENPTCEMYDFFMNSWTKIPSLNVPRCNINLYIDKLGTFAYAFCGIIGNRINKNYTDTIECLDLIDMNQGWAKVDYKNKAEVDLRQGENKFYPFSEDKLIIYGGQDSRQFRRCYCIFDLKKFEIVKLEKDKLEELMAKMLMNPDGEIFI